MVSIKNKSFTVTAEVDVPGAAPNFLAKAVLEGFIFAVGFGLIVDLRVSP